jgi:hypothetical protein
MLSLCVVSIAGPALAAELLDVKPVISGSNVSIEVTADIPMTYTYYKVPGQARAVVDIADVDPEKVEPLVVVNKGAIASISVDKAMIADMTVSRLVFNLVSESDIQVKQEADRKKLTVTFGAGKPVAAVVAAAPTAPPASVAVDAEPAVVPEPKKPVAVVASAAAPVSPLSKEEEDPLGLDEPKAAASAPAVANSAKLEPVVPESTPAPTALTTAVVKGMVIGSSYIEIQTNGNIDKIKQMKLVQPDRLVIDIPGVSKIAVKSISVNKFGIAKVRFGNTPGVVRIVLDATKSPFPSYSVDSSETGVRINFK